MSQGVQDLAEMKLQDRAVVRSMRESTEAMLSPRWSTGNVAPGPGSGVYNSRPAEPPRSASRERRPATSGRKQTNKHAQIQRQNWTKTRASNRTCVLSRYPKLSTDTSPPAPTLTHILPLSVFLFGHPMTARVLICSPVGSKSTITGAGGRASA